MKTGFINLETFTESFKEPQIFEAYKKINKINDIKKSECNDLAILTRELKNHSNYLPQKLFGFQLGKKVGVGFIEEFDLLRFSDTSILNIELKSQLVSLEKIQEQLIRHNFLLGCLPGNRTNILYTFISSEMKLYRLKDDELIESNFGELLNSIPDDYYEENDLLDLKAEDYIISPYSDIDRYLNTRYFLNSEQQQIVTQVTSNLSKEHVVIKGGAGTGKSLVLFELAKKLTDMGNSVLVIFCSRLDTYNEINQKVNFEFLDIVRAKNRIDSLNYDYILLDESQRLWKSQYDSLIQNKNTLVFSVDKAQTLKPEENDINIEEQLDNKIVEKNKYNLKEKVRTDSSLSTFIQKFFDKSKLGLQPIEFPKVNAVYFDSKKEAQEFVESLRIIEDYKSIEMAEYKTIATGRIKNKKIFPFSTDGFRVIGREFDNVLIPIAERFRYFDNHLNIYGGGEYYPYLRENGLFQAITRVKKNLLFVVIGSVKMYNEIQKLITWEIDRKHSQTSNRLKQLRKTSGVTIDDVIEKYKFSKETYENIEKTGIFPNNQILKDISNFYNVESGFLLGDPTQLSYTEFDILYQLKIKGKSKEEISRINNKLIDFLQK